MAPGSTSCRVQYWQRYDWKRKEKVDIGIKSQTQRQPTSKQNPAHATHCIESSHRSINVTKDRPSQAIPVFLFISQPHCDWLADAE